MHRTRVTVNPAQCKPTASNLMSAVGQLYSVSTNHFITHSSDRYSCSWLRTITHIFQHFELRMYRTYIEGHNLEIHQSLTKTSCCYPYNSCSPIEGPRSIIIWNNVFHDPNSFHTIGTYQVHRRVGD